MASLDTMTQQQEKRISMDVIGLMPSAVLLEKNIFHLLRLPFLWNKL